MEKTLYTATYAEQKTFFPLGKDKIIGFLGETIVENWNQPGAPEDAPAITGYQYTGTRQDGGTELPCDDPSDYGSLTNAIIRSRFTQSDELAIQRHYANDPVAYQAEWDDYNAFCEQAKVVAKSWL